MGGSERDGEVEEEEEEEGWEDRKGRQNHV